jgi:hypothetical protein
MGFSKKAEASIDYQWRKRLFAIVEHPPSLKQAQRRFTIAHELLRNALDAYRRILPPQTRPNRICGTRSSLHFWEQISVILVNRFSEAVAVPCQQAPLAPDAAVRPRTQAK